MARKILLIDDDSDDRALFFEALEEVSPEIVCATESNAKKALSDLLDPTIQLPDLIFVDINMPRISGWDCLDTIKSQEITKHIPVVMFSTSSHEKDVVKAKRCGAACLITKPGDYSLLKKCLSDVVDVLDGNASFAMVSSSFNIV